MAIFQNMINTLSTEVEKRVIIKRKYMEARCEYGKSNYDNFVSIDELLDLIIASGFKCVITGWYTLFTTTMLDVTPTGRSALTILSP